MAEDFGSAVGRLVRDAAARLVAAGLSEDEVLAVIERRLAGSSPAPGSDAFRREREGRWPDPEPPQPYEDGSAGPSRSRWPRRLEAAAAAMMPRPAGLPAATPVTEAPAVLPVPDEPGEPPVGSVVTDTRMRVCWRDEEGWHRGGMHVPITWAQVCQAVGGPEMQPMPGQPTIVSQPPQRAQGPTVVRPAGSLELPMQVPVLGPDGEALLGPDGQKLLRTETETMTISEVVPAGGGA